MRAISVFIALFLFSSAWAGPTPKTLLSVGTTQNAVVETIALDGNDIYYLVLSTNSSSTKVCEIFVYREKEKQSFLLMKEDNCEGKQLAVHDKKVYFSGAVKDLRENGIYLVTEEGAKKLVYFNSILNNNTPQFVFDEKYLYFSDWAGDSMMVERLLLEGGNPEIMWKGEKSEISTINGHLTQDDEALYFTAGGGNETTLLRLTKKEGKATPVIQHWVPNPTAHKGHLYWSDSYTKARRVSVNGGVIEDLGEQGRCHSFAKNGFLFDDSHLYLNVQDGPATFTDHKCQIVRMPLGGGKPETIYKGPDLKYILDIKRAENGDLIWVFFDEKKISHLMRLEVK